MSARRFALGVAALTALAASCLVANPPDGAYRCASSGRACPHGYSCLAGACYRDGHTPSGPVASAATTTLTADPPQLAADGSSVATLTVVVRDAAGNPIAGRAVTLAATGSGNVLVQPVAPSDSSGTAAGAFSSTVAEPKTVTASVDGISVSTTVVFNAAVAQAMQFNPGPGNGAPATALATIRVELVDGRGTVVPVTNHVTLALGANPGGGTLSGTVNVAAVAGVATFSDLRIDKPGNGYSLVASSGTLPVVTSSTFNVVVGLPPAPTNLVATAGVGMVTLSWTSSAGADGYNVLRSPTMNGTYAQIGTATGAMYTDGSLAPGTYFYKVDATRTGVPGASADSNIASAVVGREVCITNQTANSVVVHSAGENGNFNAARAIVGVNTLLSSPMGLAVDLAADEIFVADIGNGRITVYPRTGTGDQVPKRSISGVDTPVAVAVDPTNDDLYVVNRNATSVTVYSRAAMGATPTPKRTLGSSSAVNTTFVSPVSIAYDAANAEIFVTDAAAPNAVDVFDSIASGDVAPKRRVTGSMTALSVPQAVAVDATHNELFVANTNGNSVTVYGRTDTGNVAPKRTVAGANTGLLKPTGVVLDLGAGNLLVVSNNAGTGGSLSTFLLGDNGNVNPQKSIVGANTGLSGPFGVAFCK